MKNVRVEVGITSTLAFARPVILKTNYETEKTQQPFSHAKHQNWILKSNQQHN